jgi:hypothetical protein
LEITVPPAPTAEQAEKLKTALTQSLQSDIYATFVDGLQRRAGYTENRAALQQVITVGQAQ